MKGNFSWIFNDFFLVFRHQSRVNTKLTPPYFHLLCYRFMWPHACLLFMMIQSLVICQKLLQFQISIRFEFDIIQQGLWHFASLAWRSFSLVCLWRWVCPSSEAGCSSCCQEDWLCFHEAIFIGLSILHAPWFFTESTFRRK